MPAPTLSFCAQSKFAAQVVDRYEHALAAEARRQVRFYRQLLNAGIGRQAHLTVPGACAHLACIGSVSMSVLKRGVQGPMFIPGTLIPQGMDGVICGHIHYPRIRDINGVTYVNDGDWVRGPIAG